MTYLFRFLLKIILLFILLIESSSQFNYMVHINGHGGNMILPGLSIILLINIIYEGVLLTKTKNWHYIIKESDERTQKFTLKAGYIGFWINAVGILLILIFYSSESAGIVKPLDLMGYLFILEILVFYIAKYFYMHDELKLKP